MKVILKKNWKEYLTKNKVFSSGQAIREASLTVLRPTLHGSEMSRTQKHNQSLSQTWTA